MMMNIARHNSAAQEMGPPMAAIANITIATESMIIITSRRSAGMMTRRMHLMIAMVFAMGRETACCSSETGSFLIRMMQKPCVYGLSDQDNAKTICFYF